MQIPKSESKKFSILCTFNLYIYLYCALQWNTANIKCMYEVQRTINNYTKLWEYILYSRCRGPGVISIIFYAKYIYVNICTSSMSTHIKHAFGGFANIQYVRVYLCISLVCVLGTSAYFQSLAREKIFLSELTFTLKGTQA
jgi:hypothetical protein